VLVEIVKMSDRQNLLKGMEARQAGLDAYMLDRLDMFWIHVNGTRFCVEPREDGSWYLSHQHGETETRKRRKIADLVFEGSDEEKQQRFWMKQLVDGGYFEDGRWPGVDTYRCDRCGQTWKNGTTHEHVLFDGNVVAHSGRNYQKIQERGFEVSWRPGRGSEMPSLEESGYFEEVGR